MDSLRVALYAATSAMNDYQHTCETVHAGVTCGGSSAEWQYNSALSDVIDKIHAVLFEAAKYPVFTSRCAVPNKPGERIKSITIEYA